MELNIVGEKILSEIARRGAISFARFMELALYCPEIGYYEREADIVGRRGDFYTSVSVGGLFGELLAWQFGEWLRVLNAAPGAPHSPLRLVEAGAHDGRLARDVLAAIHRTHPELWEQLEYWIIEPSERRQTWQRETVREFAARVRWAATLAELAGTSSPGVRGVIFSNELLDAFPVHRLSWDRAAAGWFEWGVSTEGGRFIWARLAEPPAWVASCWVGALPEDLLAVLPDGYTVEAAPAAEAWWRTAAELIVEGRLITFDYGLTTAELVTPERQQGTMRAYRRHRAGEDVLANPGEQDLTAHVNFSALQAAGEAGGLRTDTLQTQGRFLTQLALERWRGQEKIGWTAAQWREFQTLIHPVHLGHSFRVLVQSRGG